MHTIRLRLSFRSDVYLLCQVGKGIQLGAVGYGHCTIRHAVGRVEVDKAVHNTFIVGGAKQIITHGEVRETVAYHFCRTGYKIMSYVFKFVSHFYRRHVAGIKKKILGVQPGIGHSTSQL